MYLRGRSSQGSSMTSREAAALSTVRPSSLSSYSLRPRLTGMPCTPNYSSWFGNPTMMIRGSLEAPTVYP